MRESRGVEGTVEDLVFAAHLEAGSIGEHIVSEGRHGRTWLPVPDGHRAQAHAAECHPLQPMKFTTEKNTDRHFFGTV